MKKILQEGKHQKIMHYVLIIIPKKKIFYIECHSENDEEKKT